VHGFNHDFGEALTRTAKLCAWLEDGGAPALLPLSFTWPSQGNGSPDGYAADGQQSARSGLALAKLMGAIAKANQPRAVVHLVAHSMGVRTTRHAMQAIGPLLPGMALPVFDQAFLMAGDDEADVLAPPVQGDASSGGLRPIADLAAHVTVGVNRDDGVVWLVAGLATGWISGGSNRLGAAGPRPRIGLPANLKVVDYSMVVLASGTGQVPHTEAEPNWVGHQYYRNAPRVRADLVAALIENGPPEGLLAVGPPHGQPRRRWGEPGTTAVTEYADRLYPA
jgi:esterase/lipase superfamily enzyme